MRKKKLLKLLLLEQRQQSTRLNTIILEMIRHGGDVGSDDGPPGPEMPGPDPHKPDRNVEASGEYFENYR